MSLRKTNAHVEVAKVMGHGFKNSFAVECKTFKTGRNQYTREEIPEIIWEFVFLALETRKITRIKITLNNFMLCGFFLLVVS